MEEELELTTTEDIQNLIYTVRGKQVMLDSDVANLYHYETKKINQAVKRNIERFPEDFCFQLTESELENLRSQFVTSSLGTGNYGGRRYLPYVFTEQGIAMLAPLLKNKIAVQVSINIMNAFVIMRHFLKENGQIFERLTSVEYKLIEHDKKFDIVFDKLQEKQIQFLEGSRVCNDISYLDPHGDNDIYCDIIDFISDGKVFLECYWDIFTYFRNCIIQLSKSPIRTGFVVTIVG